ncbi:MAG: DNA-processing protein DprA [Gemmatimonadota bacterium]|nr:DNA-processing protein DprA [Gemmatimonadota bacterium]
MTPRSPDEARRAALALALLPGVGPISHRELIDRHGAKAALAVRGNGTPLRAAIAAADAALERAHEVGARLISRGDADYPERLNELPDAPPALFALGDPGCLGGRCVAVVGTRDPTAYGERVARDIAGALARAGAVVVSGMARGIDAVAHRAALEAGGPTVAVLGTGIDVPYPAAHRGLHAEIARCGLVLSEEMPGARAVPGSFPKRNRVIAGLCLATIVVEAGVRSGALITAGHALDLGRAVAAVPGPIDAPRSAGSNGLLRDGAVVIAEAADAVMLAGLTTPSRPEPKLSSPAERAVWDALANGAADLDTLASRAALPARECMVAVAALEVAGAIECSLVGEVRRR